MNSLADILFGDKKSSEGKRESKTNSTAYRGDSAENMKNNERKSINILKNKQSEYSNKETTNTIRHNSHSIQYHNNSLLSKSQEIKKSIQINKTKSTQNTIKQPVKRVRSLDSKEERLYSKLKNFNSIDEILNEVQSNNKEYVNLFKDKDNGYKDIEPVEKQTRLPGNYKPTSTDEAKVLNKIDEINKMKEIQEITLLGKKHGNRSETGGKSSKSRGEDDIWCSKCRLYHHKDLHKKIPMTNYPNHISGNNYQIMNYRVEPNVKQVIPIMKQTTNDSFIRVNPCQNNKNANRNVNNSKPLNQYELLNKLKQQIKINNLNSNNNTNNNIVSNNYKVREELKKHEIPHIKTKNVATSRYEETKNKERLEAIKKTISINNNNINYKQEFQHSHYKTLYKTSSKPINYSKSSIDSSQHQKSIPINSNYSPTNPIDHSQKDLLFSRRDFEDDFIDDRDEEDPDEVRRYLDTINRKLRRGGGNYYHAPEYSDSDEVIEAKFDEIEEEEKYTEFVGQKEDEEEERREMLEMEKKRIKKLNKY